MPRRQDPRDLSSAAQEYLLALRVIAADGSKVTAAQVARHLGVTTQAASEMFRRLVADGLVAHADSRELHLTHGRPGGRGHDLPAPRADRMAADVGRRARLGRVGRGGDAPPGRDLAPGRGTARRDARSPRDVPARQSHRRRDCGAPSEGHPAQRDRGRRAGHRLPHHRGGRGGRRPAVVPRGAGAPPRCAHHGPRPLRLARFAHARGSARDAPRSGCILPRSSTSFAGRPIRRSSTRCRPPRAEGPRPRTC